MFLTAWMRAAGMQDEGRHGAKIFVAAFLFSLPAGLLLGLALIGSAPAGAVTILDSTWAEEGGAVGREWEGFGAHLALAAEDQFRAVLALSTDNATWGEASDTWIGNDERHAYILTAAHIYELPASPAAYSVRGADGRVHYPDRIWVDPEWTGAVDDGTGHDFAILRLAQPLTDLGPQPVLYAGDGELSQ